MISFWSLYLLWCINPISLHFWRSCILTSNTPSDKRTNECVCLFLGSMIHGQQRHCCYENHHKMNYKCKKGQCSLQSWKTIKQSWQINNQSYRLAEGQNKVWAPRYKRGWRGTPMASDGHPSSVLCPHLTSPRLLFSGFSRLTINLIFTASSSTSPLPSPRSSGAQRQAVDR